MLPLPAIVAGLLQTIWIVDASNGPGTNFTDLPAAVAAAASGDTIEVRPGYYTSFTASGKALTIRGSGASTTVVGYVAPPGSAYLEPTIDNVPPGTTFHVGGLTFSPAPYMTPLPQLPYPSTGLRIQGATTRVTLADVTATGITVPSSSSSSISTGTSGLYIFGGAEVHASRCTFSGGFGTQGGGSGAVVWTGCTFAAEASTFTGGSGGGFLFSGYGGTGLAVGGTASTSHCSFYGGAGGAGGGGDAVALFVLGSFARIAAAATDVVQPGAGFLLAPSGYAIRAPAGTTAIVHGIPTVNLPPGASAVFGSVAAGPPLPYLAIGGTITAGGELLATQPVTLTFDGIIPLGPFLCAVDINPSYSTAFAPVLLGPLLVPITPLASLQGTLDALGMAQLTFTPAISTPGLIGVPLSVQFGALDASIGQIRLSNGPVWVFK